MSTDLAHKQKMKALNELIELQKEGKRRDMAVLVVSIVVNLVISIVIKLL